MICSFSKKPVKEKHDGKTNRANWIVVVSGSTLVYMCANFGAGFPAGPVVGDLVQGR